MSREEIHQVLDQILDEAESRNLMFGQTSFVMHWQNGKVNLITEKETLRTWKNAKTGNLESRPT